MARPSELRRKMILAMGSTCAACRGRFDPSQLIIHHKTFDKGKPLGYQHPSRYQEIYEWNRTGKLPENVELLCDDCNRKRHGYRASFEKMFGVKRIRC